MSGGGAFSDAARAAIYEIGGHRCIGCGRTDLTCQHRRPRGMGGTSNLTIGHPANGVPLCGSGTTGCHGWAERWPAAAMLLGWRLEGGDPCEEPFWSRGWEWRRWQVELDGFDNARYHAAMTDTPPTDQPLRPGAAVDGVPLSRIIRPDRHKSVMDVYEWFECDRLRNNLAREVSADFHELGGGTWSGLEVL